MLRKILHNLSIILNSFFALLLLLATFSVYVNPEKLWIAPFFGLTYPYLLLVNLFFIVYWLVKRQKLFIISLLTVILGVNCLSAFIQLPVKRIFTSSPDSTLPKLKVLSFNVRAFNRYKWMDDLNDYSEIFNYIKHNKPDIICFQEFYKQEKGKGSIIDMLNRLKPAKYYYAFYSYNGQNPANFGIAVFSKFPILGKGKLIFKNTSNISMFCNFKANGRIIRLYNNHLQSIRFIKGDYDFIDSLKFEYNERQAAGIKDISVKLKDAYKMRAHQVSQIAEHINKSPYPVIVCGDFNDTPVSYTYYKMKSNLKDAFRVSGIGVSNTYVGKFPSFRIDYIFYSPAFDSYSYNSYNTKTLSDHYPVECTVIIK